MFFKKKNKEILKLCVTLYKLIVKQARAKEFYSNLKIPDTIDGRFELVVLHFFLLERTLNKEIWIGFKTRLPKDFTHIDDRVLFFQFKNQHDPMKRSPLLGIRFYENGNVLDLGGDTGGSAGKSWSQEESDIHGIRAKFKKKELNWFVFQEKNRGEKKIKLKRFTLC